MIREFRAYDTRNYRYWDNHSNDYLLSLEGEFLETQLGDAGELEDIIPCPEGDRFIFEQWTGMVDKNGTKIFEGDICKATEVPDYFADDKPTPVVVAVTIDFVTPLSDEHGGGPDGETTYRDIEVIGNIHDNPELLESDKQEERASHATHE